jgi:hypothetical protein
MGTGRFAGSSSGALGRGSSGARYSSGSTSAVAPGSSMALFFGPAGGGNTQAPAANVAGAVVRDTFAQRGVSEYIYKMISSPAVQGMFEELFTLSVLLMQNKMWDAITERYGIPDQPGCLAELSTAIKRNLGAKEPLEAFREVAGISLDDVLLAAIGEDDDIFLDGRADDVLTAAQKHGTKIFGSLSGYYLGSVLNRAAIREVPPLSDQQKISIQVASQERADFIIRRFERTYMGKEQTTYRRMLSTFQNNEDWFRDKLREEIPA